MKFKDIQKLSDVKFRRLTGVSWATFNLMLAELNKHLPRHMALLHKHSKAKLLPSYLNLSGNLGVRST